MHYTLFSPYTGQTEDELKEDAKTLLVEIEEGRGSIVTEVTTTTMRGFGSFGCLGSFGCSGFDGIFAVTREDGEKYLVLVVAMFKVGRGDVYRAFEDVGLLRERCHRERCHRERLDSHVCELLKSFETKLCFCGNVFTSGAKKVMSDEDCISIQI
jgi:hypothetical protein